ncbi:MAG: demethoxyubiquinone hydroxylase family protein [Pseudomonadota bacterium]
MASPTSTAALPRLEALPRWLRNEMRSNHAGETGAVMIYRGILAVSKNEEVRGFAVEHLQREEEHLAFFDAWMPDATQSILLPLWRLAGWMLGALASFGGAPAVYLTIDAVENFVVEHYDSQISRLRQERLYPDIARLLQTFRDDEQHHREDACDRYLPALYESFAGRAWYAVVDTGSRLAVAAARLC